jgi:hypothetical protein
VTAVEPNARRLAAIGNTGGPVVAVNERLQVWAERHTSVYQAIVMNPPFSLPGIASAWIHHLDIAMRLLAVGGRLVAIVPAGFAFRQARNNVRIRSLAQRMGGYETLPPGLVRGHQRQRAGDLDRFSGGRSLTWPTPS